MQEKTDEQLVKETEAIVNNSEPVKEETTPEVKPTEQAMKKVKKEEVEKILNAVQGVAFKFGDCIFKVTYVNLGHKRFSATCINME